MNSAKMPLEITENDVQNTEVVQDINLIYEENSASVIESTEDFFVDSESIAELEEIESTETTLLSESEETEDYDGSESTAELEEIESTETTLLSDAEETEDYDGSESTAELEEVESTETTLLSDAQDADASEALESTVVAVDYTDALVLIHEDLAHMNQCFDIVVMVLLAWFGSWVFRSWRTWLVKGGK